MKNRSKVVEAAHTYTRRGWSVIPVPGGEKAPQLKGWQKLRLDKNELEDFFDEDSNVGILVGKPSGNLTDVDLDCKQARLLAPSFLPLTKRIHGRKSRRFSHYWYYSKSAIKPEKFSDLKGESLVEIRSTGQQTICPPSRHPSGEVLRWESKGKPARVRNRVLLLAVKKLATASLLARHWPRKGTRDETAMALAGLLLRAGWNDDEVEFFVSRVASAGGDDELRKRKEVVRRTGKRLHRGRSITGRPRLEKLLSKDIVDRACEWLGIQTIDIPTVNAATTKPPWPAPLSNKALFGLAGDVVKTIAPHTEADPAALLVHFLVAMGNVIGRETHVHVGATKHFANLFCVVVGQTSRARKGTAWSEIRHLFERVDDVWLTTRQSGGLSSGEGLTHAVRDPGEVQPVTRGSKNRPSQSKRDPGILDKRLLVVESEFASVLKVIRREGNTLSIAIRDAWDRGNLGNMTKNSPARATGAHISIIAHITREEVLREFRDNDGSNGFANRFLWLCAKRSKRLPFGGRVDVRELIALRARIKRVVRFAKQEQEIRFSFKARVLWARRYRTLTREIPGLLGGVLSRSEAQVLRLSLLYALLDQSREIKTYHLKAAFSLWRYCEESARHIFGDRLGNSVAERILNALRRAPEGVTRTRIRNLFSHNRSQSEIAEALSILSSSRLAYRHREKTDGRPNERWFALDLRPKRPKAEE
jgi:hypothetical protein